MRIIFNGQAVNSPNINSLQDFLQAQDNLPEQFAIAVNGAFVAQGLYTNTPINEGDDIELLVPMQGG